MELDFRTLDVFTEETFGGNPLGVFPDAAHLPSELMQKVAREMNLAETVFLGPPETPEGTARVRIFTPEVEVPFAGHPTVGAAIYLAGTQPVRRGAGVRRTGDGQADLVLEENVGLVPVSVEYRRGRPVFAQFTTAMLPERGESPHPPERLAAMVGLEADDLGGDHPRPLTPAMMSCGLPFHVIPVRTVAAVGRAVLDTALCGTCSRILGRTTSTWCARSSKGRYACACSRPDRGARRPRNRIRGRGAGRLPGRRQPATERHPPLAGRAGRGTGAAEPHQRRGRQGRRPDHRRPRGGCRDLREPRRDDRSRVAHRAPGGPPRHLAEALRRAPLSHRGGRPFQHRGARVSQAFTYIGSLSATSRPGAPTCTTTCCRPS